ncbi:hypothetical protein AB0M43_01895 [Longispora sp. NPDC051575]|uniref:hypothetical protein n=1 Tax=Longispora sp. NPDC051575 TaxID=3154943 RepID=UPI00342A74DA
MNLHRALHRTAVALAAPLALAGAVAAPASAHAVSGPAFSVQCGNGGNQYISCFLYHSATGARTIRWSQNGMALPWHNDAEVVAIPCELGRRGVIQVEFTTSQGTSATSQNYICSGIADV